MKAFKEKLYFYTFLKIISVALNLGHIFPGKRKSCNFFFHWKGGLQYANKIPLWNSFFLSELPGELELKANKSHIAKLSKTNSEMCSKLRDGNILSEPSLKVG